MCFNAALKLKCTAISGILREQRSRTTNAALVKYLKKSTSPSPNRRTGQINSSKAAELSAMNFLLWPSEGSIPSHMERNSATHSLPTILIKRHIFKNLKGVYVYVIRKFLFPRHNPYLCKIVALVFNHFQ